MIVLALALLVGAVLYKKFFSPAPDGFPGYLAYVVIVALLPPAYCFPWVMASINWRAFSFTQLAMVLVCVLWEVTLAAPLQWWGFRPEMMTGIYIPAWSNLPMEEPLVWLASPFTVIITYEMVRRCTASASPDRFVGRQGRQANASYCSEDNNPLPLVAGILLK